MIKKIFVHNNQGGIDSSDINYGSKVKLEMSKNVHFKHPVSNGNVITFKKTQKDGTKNNLYIHNRTHDLVLKHNRLQRDTKYCERVTGESSVNS